MKPVRPRALQLRLSGRSYNEIQKALGIPKSTLSGWFKDVYLSDKARDRLSQRMKAGFKILATRNKLQTKQAWERARRIQKTAQKEIGSISQRELFLIGSALYWAEGYKRLRVVNGKERTHHIIGLTNADPYLIAVFVDFLKKIMRVSENKIYATMRLFPHSDTQSALRYWKHATGLSEKNFKTPTYLISRSSQGKREYHRLPHGTLQVSVHSTEKFHQILGWIAGLKKIGYK